MGEVSPCLPPWSGAGVRDLSLTPGVSIACRKLWPSCLGYGLSSSGLGRETALVLGALEPPSRKSAGGMEGKGVGRKGEKMEVGGEREVEGKKEGGVPAAMGFPRLNLSEGAGRPAC